MSVSFGALAFGTPVSIGWSVVLVPLPLVSGISLRRDATTRVCASCVCDFGQPCASTGGLDGRHRFYRVQSVQPVCAPVCVRVLRGEGGVGGLPPLLPLRRSFVIVPQESAHFVARYASRSQRRERKKNLGSDLNLVSTGVWPCRNDLCVCDVTRVCIIGFQDPLVGGYCFDEHWRGTNRRLSLQPSQHYLFP